MLFRVTLSVHSDVSMISDLNFQLPFPAFHFFFLSTGYHYFVMLSSTCKSSIFKIPLPYDIVCCLSFCLCVILLKTSHTLMYNICCHGDRVPVFMAESYSTAHVMKHAFLILFDTDQHLIIFYLFATVNHKSTVS